MSGIIDYKQVFAAAGKPSHSFWRDDSGRIIEQTPATVKAIMQAKATAAKKRKRVYPENAAGKLHLMERVDGPQTWEQFHKTNFKTPRVQAIAYTKLKAIAEKQALQSLGLEEVEALPVKSEFNPDKKPAPATLPKGFFGKPETAPENPEAPEVSDEKTAAELSEAALRRMNKGDLMEYANGRGIDMSEARNKAEMIDTILNQ